MAFLKATAMIAGVLSAAVAFAAAPMAAPGGSGDRPSPSSTAIKVNPADPQGDAIPFPLTDVRLLPSAFLHAQDMDHAYLLSLDPDRLLHMFRLNAGLPSTAQPLGGWEKPDSELRGHIMGHYLSACSLMYASTGDPKLKARIDYLVGELAKCQNALAAKGSHPGYLSAFPESFFDRVDTGRRVWAPWYTMHKIMAGLLDASQYGQNPEALIVLNRLADWVKFRVDRLSTAQFQKSLETEQGGMNEVLANLYAVTHNADDLRLSQAFNHQAIFAPLAKGEDHLDRLHANTQIPKIIGAAREFELTHNDTYQTVAATFWNAVALERSYVIGGDSDGEHFFPVADFDRHLDAATAETCNTYNMLKLTRHIFAWDPTGKTGMQAMDFYERALYNDILASQDPATGMFTYFMSMQPGHFKTYSTPDNSFWCCVGTGMENHAKYGDTIYFHDDRSLFVNLFIPSELTWAEKGITITQQTQFPEADTTRLTIHTQFPAVSLPIHVRIPDWVAGPATIRINQAPMAGAAPQAGAYTTISGQWHEGDTIDLTLPMALHTVPLPHDDSIVAILDGPIVLAGDMGTSGIADMPRDAAGQGAYFRVPNPPAPGIIAQTAADILPHLQPVAGKPLTFMLSGIARPSDITLRPFYQITHDRYTVYWKLYDDAGWQAHAAAAGPAEVAREARQARIVDEVYADGGDSEGSHHLQGDRSILRDNNEFLWRESPASFSYDLAADAGPMVVQVRYFTASPQANPYYVAAAAAGPYTFDILVDGQKIATQNLADLHPARREQTITADYPIPAAVGSGKKSITVAFRPHSGDNAGRVISVSVLRAGTASSR